MGGGGLGFATVGQSVGVKFDLFNNAGEGNNSTGEYNKGAAPNIPATTIAGGVNLHSGDIFQGHMTYNGTTLTLTITDTMVPTDTFTTSWILNIPTEVGGTVAYIGFTWRYRKPGRIAADSDLDVYLWHYDVTCGNAHIQPARRHLRWNAVGDHLGLDSERFDLLHAQRNATRHRCGRIDAGLHRSYFCGLLRNHQRPRHCDGLHGQQHRQLRLHHWEFSEFLRWRDPGVSIRHPGRGRDLHCNRHSQQRIYRIGRFHCDRIARWRHRYVQPYVGDYLRLYRDDRHNDGRHGGRQLPARRLPAPAAR